MKKEQWTVIGLLVALLGLEVVRSQNVRGFFTGAWANFQTALTNASNIVPAGLPGVPGVPGIGGGSTPAKSAPPTGGIGGGGAKGTPSQKPVTLPGGTGGGILGGGGASSIPNWGGYGYPPSTPGYFPSYQGKV